MYSPSLTSPFYNLYVHRLPFEWPNSPPFHSSVYPPHQYDHPLPLFTTHLLLIRDRCEYTFHHPFENTEVRMIMYYKDMSQITAAGTAFRFRLRKNLAAFSGDFEASNNNHSISITLTASAIVAIKDIVNMGHRNNAIK